LNRCAVWIPGVAIAGLRKHVGARYASRAFFRGQWHLRNCDFDFAVCFDAAEYRTSSKRQEGNGMIPAAVVACPPKSFFNLNQLVVWEEIMSYMSKLGEGGVTRCERDATRTRCP
jgi:hypothetical protein